VAHEGNPPAGEVYQLRAVLAGISPLIWRRLLVTDRTTIAELHEVMQTVFGWSGEHLHRFIIHAVDYGRHQLGGPWFSHDADQVRLSRFGLRVGERFAYEYDFLAGWRVEIRVEQIGACRAGRRYPACIGGARAAPPEECRGARDYLALRQRWPRWAVAARIAKLLRLVLEADAESSLAEVLGESRSEMAVLARLAGFDEFDCRAVDAALCAPPPAPHLGQERA
jgi:hypothetical protein